MPAGTEMDILRFIDMEGGETRMGAIKRLLSCYGRDYVELICGSLGRNDFIDWFRDGKVKLTDKGRRALGKTPPEEEPFKGQSFNQYTVERSPESPQEKYRRWMGRSFEEQPALTVEAVLKGRGTGGASKGKRRR